MLARIADHPINRIDETPAMELACRLCQTGGMTSEPLATWVGFLASPAAPQTAMQPMVLDGYLTGIIVAPALILPSRWLAGLWGSDEPIFDSAEQMQTVLSAVMDYYNDLIAAIDDGFERLEAKQPLTYRPLFQASGDRPTHDVVRTWMTGFGKAMALTPDAWSSLIADQRMQRVTAPLIGFMEIDDPAFEPAENIHETPRRGRSRNPANSRSSAQSCPTPPTPKVPLKDRTKRSLSLRFGPQIQTLLRRQLIAALRWSAEGYGEGPASRYPSCRRSARSPSEGDKHHRFEGQIVG